MKQKSDFLAQAYTYKHNWWRFLLALVLFFVSFILFFAVLDAVIIPLLFKFFGIKYEYVVFLDYDTDVLVEMFGYAKVFVDEMSLFVVCLALFLLFFKLVHKGKIKSLFTAFPKFRVKNFMFGVALYGIIWFGITLIELSCRGMLESIELTFRLKDFVICLGLCLLLYPIQTLFEEIFCRAYLQQGVALLVRQRLVTLLLIAVFFGLLHSLNLPVEQYGTIALFPYILSGILFGLCSVLDDGLEMAWGIHFINNFLCTIIISTPDGENYMPAIFRTAEPVPSDWLTNVLCLLDTALFLFVATKVYHWDWRRLLQKIEKPVIIGAE